MIRRTRVKRSRGKRRGPWRSVAYRKFVASHPCCICGNPNVQAAHTERGGMGMKGSDSSCVPLCGYPCGHHDQYDGRVKMRNGGIGPEAFLSYYRINLRPVVDRLLAEWEAKTGKKAA